MASLMRPGIYWPDGGYHHIDVFGPGGVKDNRKTENVSVVGPLCENMDQFARKRSLPEIKEGDLLVIQDTGAHGHAMGFNYNGRLRCQELLLRSDGSVEMIRRAETLNDYLATLDLFPKKLNTNRK
jgi:diaminopimelate decarboxylase